MTPNEFKEKYPEYAHLEGDALWDTMTNVLIRDGYFKTITFDPPVIITLDELDIIADAPPPKTYAEFLMGLIDKPFVVGKIKIKE